MNNYFLCFTIIMLCSPIVLDAKVKRIFEQDFDLSKPFTIYMTPKRTTLIKFPCQISHSILGSSSDVDIKIGPDSKRHLVLWMPNEMSQPTNMIVPCGDEEFVFDILPNQTNHQYLVDIVGSHDPRSRIGRTMIDTSEKGDQSSDVTRKLIRSSDSKGKEEVTSSHNLVRVLNMTRKPRILISKGVKK